MNAYNQVDKYPDMVPMTRVVCSLASPEVAKQIKAIVAAEKPVAIMVDAMFPAALEVAPSFGLPITVFGHSFIWCQPDALQGIMTKLGELRTATGFAPLPDRQTLGKVRTRMIVTSVEAFDDAPSPGWDRVTHVGFVLNNQAPAQPTDLPWPEDDTKPLVLVRYITTELGGPEKMQTALNGFAGLDAHVVMTTGMAIEQSDLTNPANGHVVRYVDDNAILARTELCIRYCEHGTMMGAF